ncbi:MAG: hypothetical protein WC720_05060 [Candidatus Shapirobacteria bacterium]|jgi:hypothetical protein
MAINNRAEAIIVAEAALVPTLTLVQHKAMLNDNILNSVKFDKDVIASQTPTAGAVTIDYATKDMATVTTAVDLAVSFTNLENGAVKYLEITKAAANVISFIGVVDAIQDKNYINTILTSVCFRVSNKNGIIYVEGIISIGEDSWQALTISGWEINQPIKYRLNSMGNVEFKGELGDIPSNFGYVVATLPLNYRPSYRVVIPLKGYGQVSGVNAYPGYTIIISTNGDIMFFADSGATITGGYINLNFTMIL